MKQPTRQAYRHGDLRRALLEAGIELARVGGPEAVVLREVTRRAGVVPNAAYRHFANREDLLRAVRAAALSAVAKAMEAELAKVRASRAAATTARARVRAVGTGYLNFAREEPGLFRTAFAVVEESSGSADAAKAGDSGMNPFQLLGNALDGLVEAGVLPGARRKNAEYLAWSAVHGLASLINDGPLRWLSLAQTKEIGTRLLDMVERGV
ncbi:MAG: TetR/AcrR family transcriptional regulator [Gammaproteobacteria bacterium]